MNKAISYMILGALGAGAMILYFQNKDEIAQKMHQMRETGMRQMNKIKAHFE